MQTDYERDCRDYGREAGRMALDDLRRMMAGWVRDHGAVLDMRRPDDLVDEVVVCVEANMLEEYVCDE